MKQRLYNSFAACTFSFVLVIMATYYNNILTRGSSKKERQENLRMWMDDFDSLMESAKPTGVTESVEHYIVFFENKEPIFDTKTTNCSFPKPKDPICIDKTNHSIERETILTDPVFELAYDYFLKGHRLRFVNGQYVPGVIRTLQTLLDEGNVDYDKTIGFAFRYNGQLVRWESPYYLSRMKYVVDPARQRPVPSLRDIIRRSWPEKFPENLRQMCFSAIQECMIVDFVHSMSRMRPNFDRQLVHQFADAGLTDIDPRRSWRLDVIVDFIPPVLKKRSVADLSYDVSLEFRASSNVQRRQPYEAPLEIEDTDVEDAV